MDLAAIQSAIVSLKAATDISKAIVDLKVSTEVQDKVIELQSALLEAQNNALLATTAQFELLEQVRQLKEQIQSASDWSNQKDRYILISPWDGPAQVYALKKTHAKDENPHYLCANCFHNRAKVVLNPTNRDGWVLMSCPSCRATLETGYRGIGPPVYADSDQSES